MCTARLLHVTMRPASSLRITKAYARQRKATWRGLAGLARTGTLRELATGTFAGVHVRHHIGDTDSAGEVIEHAFANAGCTAFQVLVIILLGLSWAAIAVTVFVPVFAQGEPQWQCAQPPAGAATTCRGNSSLCELPAGAWEFTDTDANIGSEWDLVCDNLWQNQMPSSALFVGKMVGGAVLGSMADQWGRKPVFLAAGVLGMLGSVGAALSPNLWVYAASRLVVGLSAGGSTVTFVLSSELVATRWRTATGILVRRMPRPPCAAPCPLRRTITAQTGPGLPHLALCVVVCCR